MIYEGSPSLYPKNDVSDNGNKNMPKINELMNESKKKKFKKSEYRPWNYMEKIKKESLHGRATSVLILAIRGQNRLAKTRGYVCRSRPRRRTRSGTLKRKLVLQVTVRRHRF